MTNSHNQGGIIMPPVAPPTSTNAIISLIAGVLGFIILPLIGGVIAIMTGNAAKKEIANSGNTLRGDGLAKAGVIMGWIDLGIYGTIALVGLCVLSMIVLVPLFVALLSWIVG